MIIPHIDWFQFTFNNEEAPHVNIDQWTGISRPALLDILPNVTTDDDYGDGWVEVQARQPYRHAYQHVSTAVRLSWHAGVGEGIVEVPGRACRALASVGRLMPLLEKYAARCSRIDYAVDMETDTRPSEFVNSRSHKKFRSLSYFDSAEGETVYTGSWNSDRFARVYRYAPPHERAHLLRAEHVFKRRHARMFLEQFLGVGGSGLMEATGKTFGWAHQDWKPALAEKPTVDDLARWRPERHASKTLLWLERTAIPAIVRLAIEGEIDDVTEWLHNTVYTRLAERRAAMSTLVSSVERKL